MTAQRQQADRSSAQRTTAGASPAAACCSPLAARLGNQQLQQLLQARLLQAKLTVSQPHDEFELEADRVADQVMRMPDATVQVAAQSAAAVQRKCSRCEEELRRTPEMLDELQRSAEATAAAQVNATAEASIRALSGRGSALPQAVRSFMEPRFNADFSAVRVHTDPEAHQLARSVQARAFTVGNDVVFAAGHYAPHTDEGRRLIAHELTHVIQQGRAGQQLQRWASCKPARMSLEDCPARTAGEAQRAKSGAMVFLPGMRIPGTGETGVLIANFDIGSDAIKPNLHSTLYWQQFLRTIAANGSRWRMLGFTDCQGADRLNQNLRAARAAAVFKLLPAQLRSQIVSQGAAPIEQCVTENDTAGDRALNRSVAFVLDTSVANMQAEEITAPCTPPTVGPSSGKRCKFYVYDSTEPSLSKYWKAAAFGLATGRPGAYVIPSGDNVEEALKGIIDTYAAKDCDCTSEIQFWSHGSPGNAMSVTKSNDELNSSHFKIPELGIR
ncbi:MAG: DUF4157 domain-containing protein [Gammaproteobacteria bacterium]|nr:DUF4157 domain-containing protein [Gammaproteobacteria bacterium]